jgi:hypothetical protein
VEDARVDGLAVGFGADSEVREAVERTLIGAVGDFPVHQASGGGQADASGADTAEREGHVPAPLAVVVKVRAVSHRLSPAIVDVSR